MVADRHEQRQGQAIRCWVDSGRMPSRDRRAARPVDQPGQAGRDAWLELLANLGLVAT